MQSANSHNSNVTQAKPIQVGTQPGEVERLSQEISHTGVANSAEDVERLATEGPNVGEDKPREMPIPIVTSG